LGALCAVPLLLACWTPANASTTLAVADGNVNFLFGELGTAQLAMFDDGDFGGTALNIPLPSIVGISGPVTSGNYIATNELLDSISLTANPWFVLGVSTDGGSSWIQDSGVTNVGGNALRVVFQLGPGSAGSVLAVDVNVQTIPVPAAVWLFGSGLLGLAGFAHRKKVKSGKKGSVPF